MCFFDFNLKININTLYYLFLNILKSQIPIIKEDKSVWDLEISLIDIKFTIIFISHLISDILIIEYQMQKSDVFDIDSKWY